MFVLGAYGYLLALALILLFTKIFGLATAHVHLPQVVGALIAGILLGPSGIGILHESDFLTKTAEIGVIMLLFIAGIDTDINELKHTGPAACLIAVLGVAVPIIGCGGVYWLFFSRSFSFFLPAAAKRQKILCFTFSSSLLILIQPLLPCIFASSMVYCLYLLPAQGGFTHGLLSLSD